MELTPTPLMTSLALIFGLLGLVWSADKFVEGAAVTARNLGMSSLMIGLTIVSFGTSAPEILVSYNAAMQNASDMAIGNALGSNLANIGMVLAVTVFVAPVIISRGLLKREIPLLLVVTLLAGYCLLDHMMEFHESIILIGALIVTLWLSIEGQKLEVEGDPAPHSDGTEELPDLSKTMAWISLIGGLLLLVLSSRVLVWGAKEAALYMGVSQTIIGLTLVAIGTSLPELAASVMSAIKGHVDIALGNVIGSNLFNIVAVMAVPGFFATVQLEPSILNRDYAFMAGLTGLMVAIILFDSKVTPGTPKLGKVAGGTFLAVYLAYYYLLFAAS
jgi:cation:H+ antiporter